MAHAQGVHASFQKLQSISWEELLESGAALGTTFLLDGVMCKAMTLCVSKAGRAAVSKISEVLGSSAAQERVLEIAGIGKIALEEGTEVAKAAVESVVSNPEVVGQGAKNVIQIVRESAESTVAQPNIVSGAKLVTPITFGNLKLIGDNIWQSPGGLIYGFDRKFGNALNHVLAHMTSNPIKKNHTVFSIPREKIVALIDEAWSMKGNHLFSDPRAYVVNLKKTIGTNGETSIRIIVKEPGTTEIVTAYPV